MKNKSLYGNVIGQGIVEFALILPIFLTLVFGVIDFGRLAYHRGMMNHTAKEMLRMATVGTELTKIITNTENSIEVLTGVVSSETSSELDDEGNPCTEIIFTPSSGYEFIVFISPVYSNTLSSGDTLRVSLRYKMDYITPLGKFFDGPVELTAVYYSRVEKPPT